jgi:peptide/nickel transport system substrate-binding protein
MTRRLTTIGAVLALLAACGTGGDTTATTTGDGTAPATQTTATGGTTGDPSATTGEPSDTTASASGATGGTVRIGYGGSPDSLNPGNGLLAEAYIMYELVYDTPITVDLDGNYIPELAEEWSVSDDGLTWTLDLVEGATFHDGTPLTAEDVKYSLELWRDTPDFPYLSAYGDVFEDIQATDEQTVTITLTNPVGNFESRFVFAYIVPKAIWEKVKDPVAFDNAEMIGSGPFKLAEHRQGEFVRLEANDDYWAAPPNVDEVIFQTIQNADARVTALTTGQADMITEFPKTAVATLRNDPNITVVSGEPLSPSLVDIFFNLVEPERCPEDGVCSGHPALRDLAVRTALAHAIDKQQMIDVVMLGLGAPGLSLLAPGYGPYFNSEMQDYAFDIAEANRILDEAGYTDEDGDGVRECLPDQDCDDLTFRFNFNTDADTAPREAELVAGWWAEIGVALQIQGLDGDTLTSVCCPTFDFDIIRWSWGGDPDPAFLLGIVLCEELDTGLSETGYCNEEYDQLYADQGIETDPEARREIIWEMQEILMRDLPYIIPYYDQTVQAYRNDTFTGWQDSATRLALEDPTSLTVIRPAG